MGAGEGGYLAFRRWTKLAMWMPIDMASKRPTSWLETPCACGSTCSSSGSRTVTSVGAEPNEWSLTKLRTVAEQVQQRMHRV